MSSDAPRAVGLFTLGVVNISATLYYADRRDDEHPGLLNAREALYAHMRANSFTCAIWLNVLLQGVTWMVLMCRLSSSDHRRWRKRGERLLWGWIGLFLGAACAFPWQVLCDTTDNALPEMRECGGVDSIAALLAFVMMYILPVLLTWTWTNGVAILVTTAILGMIMPMVYEKLTLRPCISYQTLQWLAMIHSFVTWLYPLLWPPSGELLPNMTSKSMCWGLIGFHITATVWIFEAGRVRDASLAIFSPAAAMFATFHHLDIGKADALQMSQEFVPDVPPNVPPGQLIAGMEIVRGTDDCAPTVSVPPPPPSQITTPVMAGEVSVNGP